MTLERKIESFVRRAINTYRLFDGAEKSCIALSGGKDSLTLLHMLARINGKGLPLQKLYAVHIGGGFSCGASLPSNFLRPFCERAGVELHIIDTPQRDLKDLECYSCSQTRRRLLFAKAKELGCTHIAFGHHKDDANETLLLNLFHKAEFAGMLPKVEMKHFGITIVRPLYYVEEAAIRRFAQMQDFLRITCRCPVGQHSQRRKVKELIAAIEEHFPHIRGNLAQAVECFGLAKAKDP